MRRAARVDVNQSEVVKALREVGATVQPIHTIGDGCPDLLVGYHGANYVMEVKDGSKPPSKRQLTPDEAKWFKKWRGQRAIVNNVNEALACIGAIQ